MKLSKETTMYIALTVIKEVEKSLKGKKLELLKSNENNWIDDITYHCINESNISATTALTKLSGGITKVVITYIGKLSINEERIITQLTSKYFYTMLYVAIDEQARNLAV